VSIVDADAGEVLSPVQVTGTLTGPPGSPGRDSPLRNHRRGGVQGRGRRDSREIPSGDAVNVVRDHWS
jgi:hypothetical protein